MSDKIGDYKVIKAGDYQVLAIAVNNHLKEGWQPLGGAIAINEPPTALVPTFYQTMVKQEQTVEDMAVAKKEAQTKSPVE